MTGILTTARLVCKDSQSRDTAIEAFRKIIAYTTPNEPEVLQYVCALPVDDDAGTEIYMIEEYANQAASDAHLATKPVQDLIQLFTTGEVLAAPPEVHNCPVRYKSRIVQSCSLSTNPAIVLLHTTSPGVDASKDAAERMVGNVKELNFLALVEDKETNGVRIQIVMDSWKSYEKFEKTDKAKGLTTNASSVVKIKAIAGFLCREDKSKL